MAIHQSASWISCDEAELLGGAQGCLFVNKKYMLRPETMVVHQKPAASVVSKPAKAVSCGFGWSAGALSAGEIVSIKAKSVVGRA